MRPGLASKLTEVSYTSLPTPSQVFKRSRLCAGPRLEQGVPDEAMRRLPSATVRVLDGLPSIDGKKVTCIALLHLYTSVCFREAC